MSNGIPQEVHDRITEIELLSLIEACTNCRCGPEAQCYCDSNLGWAERKLAELRQRRANGQSEDE